MKDIKGIGFNLPSENDDFISLDSFSSLADTDIAIFSPNLETTDYSTIQMGSSREGVYEGKVLYNKESSVLIKDHIAHWEKELLSFVENGGTLFVVLSKKDYFYIYSGSRSLSGTGRNQKVTNHVEKLTNYDFLPFRNIQYHIATGKNIVPQSSLVKDLFNHFKEYFTFETYIVSEKINSSIFTTKNKDRTLGATFKIKKGFLIFLPNLNLDIERFTEINKETNQEQWSTEAISQGKILVNCLVEIDNILRNKEEKSPKPNWLDSPSFELLESVKTRNLIEKKNQEIEKRKREVEDLKLVIEKQDSLKDLLFETGKPLEIAVIKALKILGYEAENYDDGELELDQIILSPEGHRYIGECEGKVNKDIDISKFRQLLDGLNADFEKETVTEKAFGLLIGNPQRLLNPTDRVLDFTLKCKQGAKRENIGLIKTVDLFYVCKYITENNDIEYAAQCRNAIFNQLGKIVEFPQTK